MSLWFMLRTFSACIAAKIKYSSPLQLRYPGLSYFCTMLFWIGSQNTQVKLFFPPVTLFSPPSYTIFSFFPQVTLFSSATGGKIGIFLDSIVQDIYYIKQTLSGAIFTATLIWNSAGHLLHKTNPDLSYFKLSYVFWEHNDSVG